MKKTILPALLATLSFAAVGAYASDAPAASPAPARAAAAKKPATVFCAVTGEKIGDPSKASGSSVYKGKTYYFCCGGCKPQFDKDPAKFAKAADAKAKSEEAPKKATPKKPA